MVQLYNNIVLTSNELLDEQDFFDLFLALTGVSNSPSVVVDGT
jgi:hypothetical protein